MRKVAGQPPKKLPYHPKSDQLLDDLLRSPYFPFLRTGLTGMGIGIYYASTCWASVLFLFIGHIKPRLNRFGSRLFLFFRDFLGECQWIMPFGVEPTINILFLCRFQFWLVVGFESREQQNKRGETMLKIIYKGGTQVDEFECQYYIDYERRVIELISGLKRKRIIIPFEQILRIVR